MYAMRLMVILRLVTVTGKSEQEMLIILSVAMANISEWLCITKLKLNWKNSTIMTFHQPKIIILC